MTDNFGSDSHDRENEHEDAISQENEAVHEPPSDYEFADDHASVAEQTEEETLASDPAPARRSPVLPILAALGGVVLLGAVAWWQFGGNAVPQIAVGSTPSIQPLTTEAPAPVVKEVPAPVAVAPKTSATPSVDASAAAPVAPVAVSALSDVKSSVSPAAPVVAPVPVTPVAPAMPVSAAPVAAPVAASVGANPDRRVEALTARIDDLQKALEQANQQLGQMANVIAAKATPVGDMPPSKEVQDRIDRLEQKLASMPSTPAAPHAAPVDMMSTEAGLMMSEPVHAKKVVAKPAKVTKAVVHSAKQAKKASAVEAKSPASSWVLRAASPEQAWVASSAASHDLKQVQVGDTLPGVGRVTAIEQQGEDWVVRGTKGTIK